MLIRHADPHKDAAACAAIYAPAVNDGAVSFEQNAPSPTEMRQRIERTTAHHPWLVAELDGEPVGYAYATEHRTRAAYRWATDTSVYVAPAHHRQGIGRALYAALLPLLARQGFYVACAGITLPNPASVALHESAGFEPVGIYNKIGFKHGRWWGVGWWQAQLREQPDDSVPADPGPPARLDQPEAAPGPPEAAPGPPEAAPGPPEAAPGQPEAAPDQPDAAPASLDAAANSATSSASRTG